MFQIKDEKNILDPTKDIKLIYKVGSLRIIKASTINLTTVLVELKALPSLKRTHVIRCSTHEQCENIVKVITKYISILDELTIDQQQDDVLTSESSLSK